MPSGITPRKRDRLTCPFNVRRRPVNEPPSAGVASSSSIPAQLVAMSPQTNDPTKDFLQEAIKELTEDERSTIEQTIKPNIEGTVQGAYDEAQRQKAAWEKKRWPGGDKVDKVLCWLDQLKSIGDVVANVNPVHVGLPWAGIRLLLAAVVADSNQMIALVSGMDLSLCIANRLQAYYAYYHRLPSALTTDNFRKALIALYTLILRFLAKAIRLCSKNTAARKASALWSHSDITGFKSECDRLAGMADIAAKDCDRELLARQWAAATRWKDDLYAKLQQLDDIRSMQSSLHALEVKVDLSMLFRVQEATHNSTAEGKLPQCLNGTRSEILQGIMHWADEPDGKLIYWLCGQAGTGKSTISRTVAQSFDEQECLGASFFFKRGEENRSNADHFFSTITAQLADAIPHLRPSVAAALDKDSFLCGRGMQVQFEKLLLQPLLGIDLAHLPRNRIVIVIDALDECDRDTDIRMFLKCLAQVQASSALCLRIFLTSRPELPIRLGFRQLDSALYHDIALEKVQEGSIRGDIRAYLDAEFARIKDLHLDLLPSDWPGERTLQALVDLADPLFIFAATVCLFVAHSKPKKRLDLILEQRHSAGSSQLARLYLPILDQLLAATEEEEQSETLTEFRKIVGPIVLAADPLSVTSLARLLNIEMEDVKFILERLYSVLHVPSNPHHPVRLLHLSFRDFLVDSSSKDKHGFWISEVDTHQRLALCCLRRLGEDGALKMDICSVARPGTRRAALSMEQIRMHISPDVAYACSYWPFHFVNSQVELCDNDEVHLFLQRHLLHWLEALSWLGRLSSAVAYIGDLLSVAQGDGCGEIAAFLQDCKRFVLQNRYRIDLAPLQVYHSAMIFAPMQSVVRNTFYTRVPRLWTLFPDAPLHWSVEILKLEGHNDWVDAVVFSPDGQLIASVSDDQTVRLWNAATGEQMQKLEGHDEWVDAVVFSPDGQLIASASGDNTVRLWSAATGEQMRKLEGHDKWVNAVAFSPDGQLIASASSDQTVRLWNAATGEQMRKLEGHDKWVNAVAFSPDGQLIASASEDETLRLWNVATGEIIQLIGDVGYVDRISFSVDGKSLETNKRNFLLEVPCPGSSVGESAQTTSLKLDDQWLCYQGDGLLWLPHEYRGSCSAAHGQVIVVGQFSGAVTIFRLLSV